MLNYREDAAGVVYASQYEKEVSHVVVYDAVKRCMDIVAASLALIIFALPMALIALIIRMDSEGSSIFSQYRVGRDGKLFRIYKFRSMKFDAPSEVPTEMLKKSQRYITRVGNILRKTSLDELPQLINVIRGDMSFVGPRPLIAGESEVHELRRRAGVYAVRPGITGWAQVNGRDNVSAQEKVEYDAEYVNGRSFAFDAHILIKTVTVVFTGDGYAEGAQRCEIRHRDKAA
ncbi:MAG: sugar transferase [Clostridia bacterium]|nr:sugar transferase [Clostridia bacterium]